MNTQALVSVIVPFLNAEKFIQEAVESVLAQTYDAWELLLIDDGSTDGSREIARRYAERNFGKVRVLEHEGRQNRGAGASRNLGIRNAEGEYIAFLDADDVWLPHKLEQQVPMLASRPAAAMLYGHTQWWYSWSGNPEDVQRDFVPKLGVQAETLVEPPRLLTLFVRREATVPCTCSVLMRRELVERLGRFEENFRYIGEDKVFYAKLCLRAPVFVADACWDRYRRHADSYYSTAKRTGQSSFARRMFLQWLERYLSSEGFDKCEVWEAVQQELWPYRHRLLSSLPSPVKKLVRRITVGGRT